jgi:hypothetical protein
MFPCIDEYVLEDAMAKIEADQLDVERDDDGVIDTLVRWAGNERDAIRELLAELSEARAENAILRAART